MAEKVRRLTVGIAQATARKGWSDATLVIDQYGPDRRQAVIKIDNPGTLAYVRERLNEIEQGWRQALAELNNG